MDDFITDAQWRQFDELGFVRLGRVLDSPDLTALQIRIDDIMVGRADIDYDRLLMQLDGESADTGFKEATLAYRKIQGLELDPLFGEYLRRPLFQDISRRAYGDRPIAAFRAMFMNKPANQGTFLPWHQDRWTFLDRDPLVTVWTALDPATVANGCVQVIPGSHRRGLINPDDRSGFLTPEQVRKQCGPDSVVHLELAAGEAVLLHNWLLHASDINSTDTARRGFSVCYMDASTVDTAGTRKFSIVFGDGNRERKGFFMSMSRRRLLSATALGMTAGMTVGAGARADITTPIDYTARATFDTAEQEFRAGGYNGQPNQPNDTTGGGLAWVQSYILMAFLRMYQAYGDPHYLDQLIDHADQILDSRDSVRNVTDYRGFSLPAWRSTNPYTAGSAILRDTSGNDLVELRTSASGANSAVATTFAGSLDSTFSLRITSSRYPTMVEEHRDLSMDPASPDHIMRRIYETFNPYGLNVTARLVGNHDSQPTLGTVPFVAQPVIFSADTGMITYAIAGLVRTILADHKLRRDPRYRRTAMTYLRAVEQAVAVHEPEWCEKRIGSHVIGYYRWTKGMFRSYDGTEQPLNWSHAIGQTLVELAAITRKPEYVRKVKLLAAMQAHEWALDNSGAYQWHYWPKFGSMYSGYQRTGSPDTDISLFTPGFPASTKSEDISHAAISVEFAVRAFEEGLAFQKSDINRLIATYTQNLARIGSDGIPTTASSVDGSGTAPSSYYLQAPRWIPLARWSPAIFEHSVSIYRARRPSLMAGHALLAISYFNWYRRLGEH